MFTGVCVMYVKCNNSNSREQLLLGGILRHLGAAGDLGPVPEELSDGPTPGNLHTDVTTCIRVTTHNNDVRLHTTTTNDYTLQGHYEYKYNMSDDAIYR